MPGTGVSSLAQHFGKLRSNFGSPKPGQGGAFQPQVMSGTANPKVMLPQIDENFSGPVTRHTGLQQNPVSSGQQTQGYGQNQPWAQQASGLMNAKVFNWQGNNQPQQLYAGPQVPPTMMTSQAPQWNPQLMKQRQDPGTLRAQRDAAGLTPQMMGWQPGNPGLYQRFGNQPMGGGYRDLDGYGGQSRQLTGWWPGGYLPQGGWGGY